jgi:hypothetical protein
MRDMPLGPVYVATRSRPDNHSKPVGDASTNEANGLP